MLELGKQYPVKGKPSASAAVIQKSGNGKFWVKISGLTYGGVFLEYNPDGTFVDSGTGIPDIQLPQEEEFTEEEFSLDLEGEEEFTL